MSGIFRKADWEVGVGTVYWEEGWGDRVGWNREGDLCFHPADPSVEKVSNEIWRHSQCWLSLKLMFGRYTLATTGLEGGEGSAIV